MGYDLHITRKNEWYNEETDQNILLLEWKDYLAADLEMRLDDNVAAGILKNNVLLSNSNGWAVWLMYSANGVDNNYAWFDYQNGNIVVKNPDREILNKMLEIAEKLKARVQGDDGEIYTFIDNNGIPFTPSPDTSDSERRKKPWWRFW